MRIVRTVRQVDGLRAQDVRDSNDRDGGNRACEDESESRGDERYRVSFSVALSSNDRVIAPVDVLNRFSRDV